MTAMINDEIDNATGYANGDLFKNAQEVREYFTVAVQREMFREDAVTDQEQLDEWAEWVVEHESHMTKQQTRSEAIDMVLEVLADGHRSDRYLRQAKDGQYFVTSDHTFLSSDGSYTPPAIQIPVSYDGTEDEDQAWAKALLNQLDELLDKENE
jgi:hypothetical protein